jgi:taurine dioxygenase
MNPTVTQRTGTVGATVAGIDLRAEQPPDVRLLLNDALHEHGVLFVEHDYEIDDADHKRFVAIFGPLHESYFNLGADPFVSVLDNVGKGNPAYGTDRWHTDASVVARPPQAASLRAILLPAIGGDTAWASMYAAYSALSSKYQTFLEGLEAVHSTETLYRVKPKAREDGLFEEAKSAVHPVVAKDPVTGKPTLYVNSNYTERILGLTDRESDSVLKMLFDHINTPDFHVRLKWDTSTVVVWEERVTQHRAINDYTGRRILHRVVVDGGAIEPYANQSA